MMTARAGSTAKGGILGRRKRVLPEPQLFVTIWRKDENGHFEQARIPLSEARKIAEATVGADRGNDPRKVQHFRGSTGARKSPDPRSKRPPHCRYCGASSTGPWGAPQICTECEKLRDRHEAASGGWIGDDKLCLRVQRTLANRERLAAAEKVAKHGPGRLEREGGRPKVSEVVDRAKLAARAQFRQRTGQSEAAE